jgi:hypothetical protein
MQPDHKKEKEQLKPSASAKVDVPAVTSFTTVKTTKMPRMMMRRMMTPTSQQQRACQKLHKTRRLRTLLSWMILP